MIICSNCGAENSMKKNGVRFNRQRYKCKMCGTEKHPIGEMEGFEECDEDIGLDADEELVISNVRLSKKSQKYQDINRIERKSFREHARVENALEEYIKALKDVISERTISVDQNNKEPWTSPSVGIVHLSDIHFNELVDIVGNHYDFRVASTRLKAFAGKIIRDFKPKGITDVYLVMTGDLLNSDRRLDELLTLATNRANATFLAVKILIQFISELANYFDVNIISVTGNESRIKDEFGFTDALATDNFDFMIYEIMKLYFQGTDCVNFISGNTYEYIIKVNNTTILIAHGHRMGKMGHTDISKVISKWVKRGVKINMVICGHLHETLITDTVLRSGSLVGNNAYADVGLNLNSRASQNYYIVNQDGTVDATKIDLQYSSTDDYYYDIDEDLDAYNAKSIDKIREKKTVFEVVI